MKASGKQVFLSFWLRRVGRVGGIGCLVPRSGPNLALFESCGAMDGESCETYLYIVTDCLSLVEHSKLIRPVLMDRQS